MEISSKERIAYTTDALLEARRSNRQLARLVREKAPVSMSEAYAVQAEVTRQLGLRIAGWKVGYVRDVRLTHAPVYQDVCLLSGASVHLPGVPEPAVEGEVGFLLGRDLPPRDKAYSEEEVAEAIEMACAAMEIGGPRLQNFMEAPMEQKVADNVGNGALVRGGGRRDWRTLDLSALRVTVEIDGKTVTDRVGGNASGNPFSAMLALANSPHRTEPLRAGQTVITGTCTGIYPGRPGNRAKATFEGLGEVRVVLK